MQHREFNFFPIRSPEFCDDVGDLGFPFMDCRDRTGKRRRNQNPMFHDRSLLYKPDDVAAGHFRSDFHLFLKIPETFVIQFRQINPQRNPVPRFTVNHV